MSKMNKKIIILSSITLLAGILYFWESSKIDGIAGGFLGVFFKTDTKYSEGYTDTGFKKITKGMTEQEILEILGEPLVSWFPYEHTAYKDKAHYVAFQYSESPTSTHYRLRQVQLENGKVVKIIAYFYLD